MCIDGSGNNVYMLASSPLYVNLYFTQTNSLYVLYRGELGGEGIDGSLTNILLKGNLQLQKYYEFGLGYGDLNYKRLCWWDNSIFLVGGKPN